MVETPVKNKHDNTEPAKKYTAPLIFSYLLICTALIVIGLYIHKSLDYKQETTARAKDITTVQQIVKTQHPEAYLVDDANDTSSNNYVKANDNHYVIRARFGTIERFCDVMIAQKTMTCQGGIPEVTVKE